MLESTANTESPTETVQLETVSSTTGPRIHETNTPVVVQLREEELQAHKQWVEAGAVLVRKEIETTTDTFPVQVGYEEVHVDRVPVNRALGEDESIAPRQEGDTWIVPVVEEELVVMGRAQTANELRLQLREEELHATKQAVQAGEVEIRKTVHEEQRQIPVDLKHEEVYVERRQVDQPISGEITDAQDKVIRVPVYEEQVQVTKQGRIAEEVVIGKNVEQERQVVSGTVRREDVEVVNTGDVEVRGDMQTRGDVDVNTTAGASQAGVKPYDTDR